MKIYGSSPSGRIYKREQKLTNNGSPNEKLTSKISTKKLDTETKILVDDRLYPTLHEAALSIGCTSKDLNTALNDDKEEYAGYVIRRIEC